MEQLELKNDDAFVKVDFDDNDFYPVNSSLSTLLKNYYDSDSSQTKNQMMEQLKNHHEIVCHAFHRMRRVFKDRKRYWVHPLNKELVMEKINKDREDYPNAKCRFLRITFNKNNNAKFLYNSIIDFDFESGLSCYSTLLLEYIIKTYDDIYIVKGRNNLSYEDGTSVIREGKEYNGKYNIAMLKCKIKGSEDKIPEENSFHFYDVVHDPGGNC